MYLSWRLGLCLSLVHMFSLILSEPVPFKDGKLIRLPRHHTANVQAYTRIAANAADSNGDMLNSICVYVPNGQSYMHQYLGNPPADVKEWIKYNNNKYPKINIKSSDNCPPYGQEEWMTSMYPTQQPSPSYQEQSFQPFGSYQPDTGFILSSTQTNFTLQGPQSYTNICVYDRFGESYMITIPGDAPLDPREWVRRNSILYDKEPLNFNHFDGTCSSQLKSGSSPPQPLKKPTFPLESHKTPEEVMPLEFQPPSFSQEFFQPQPPSKPPKPSPTSTKPPPINTASLKPSQSKPIRPMPQLVALAEDGIFPRECGVQPKTNIEDRIIRGKLSNIEKNPWQVGIYEITDFRCGGSIITNYHVVTAAHCLYNKRKKVMIDADTISVQVGQSDRTTVEPNSAAFVRRYYRHEEFVAGSWRNDIAVLVLTEPLEFSSKIAPICLPGELEIYHPGKVCIVSGWGTTEKSSLSSHLRESNLELVSDRDCHRSHQEKTVTKKMVCAGTKGHDTCKGDSGGPLACRKGDQKYYLYGITSWGVGCGLKNRPGVYTKVAVYRKWIIEQVKKEDDVIDYNGDDDDDDDDDDIDDDDGNYDNNSRVDYKIQKNRATKNF